MSPGVNKSRWDELLNAAFAIVDRVNHDQEMLTSWTFGGGTALMLQIGHRESHDIDIFIDDPQLLPHVSVSLREVAFDLGRPIHAGDGFGHIKVAFADVGEIDFIVAGHVTNRFAQPTEVLGREIQLETVSEIICKKIRFRGNSIQPRDIFDIAAAYDAGHGSQIVSALAEIAEYRDAAAYRLDKLSEVYVVSGIAQLAIKPDFEETARNAISIARRILTT